ncbi:MAG TPA: D-glycero-beta-D-manno-heptose 1-phosphate adenylyltransferase [Gemmatimonadales bacterium]|nr:D-glycero-beta-D-manno-heptose 1-phosphate adenylyltransferase [Gemmatimonadales bacterium]
MAARGPADPSQKLLSREAAVAWRRGAGGSVVFTNGIFDVLHRGHVALLVAARAEGDRLVVGLNTDASARRLKGPERPVNSAADRAFVLGGLECVDAVVLFDEDTPAELIAALQPDVLVKGADYGPGQIVGAEVVEARGGRVVRVPLEPGYSTTGLIARVRGGAA